MDQLLTIEQPESRAFYLSPESGADANVLGFRLELIQCPKERFSELQEMLHSV